MQACLSMPSHLSFLMRPSPLFFRLLIASNAFPDIGSPRSVGLKKKNLKKKKKSKKSRNRRPWYPRMTLKVNIYIFGLTKCTIYCKNVPVFVPVLLYVVTMLIFQINRIISSEKWFNCVVTFFSFCLKMPKIWVGRTTLNGAKKEDGLSRNR